MEMVENVVLTLEQYFGSYVGFLRYAVPCLAAFLLLRCILPLLTFRREPEIWGWLNMEDGTQIPITHWENVIGRSKSCDVSIQFSTISRNHAVLTRYEDGSWTICRFSGTEPLLRVAAEGNTRPQAQKYLQCWKTFLGL